MLSFSEKDAELFQKSSGRISKIIRTNFRNHQDEFQKSSGRISEIIRTNFLGLPKRGENSLSALKKNPSVKSQNFTEGFLCKEVIFKLLSPNA